jgi:glycosyltransferase involved in cell wall biosynthesis
MTPAISIVIPAYNESKGIRIALDNVRDQMDQADESYEIIVIDDGSTDDLWEVLSRLLPTYSNLRAFRLSRNFGKELALCAGLEHAKGDAIIVMDADMQHPPTMLARMIAVWRSGEADIVECTKRSRGKEPLMNKMGSKMFYGMLNNLTGYNLQGASDFKLLDRKVIQAWERMGEKNVFFRGMTKWLGFKRVELEFDVHTRAEGVSRWGFLNLLKLAISAIVSFSSLPLRLVSIFGVMFLVGAVVLGGQTLYRKMIGDAVTGFTTVIILQLIIGSIIMVSLGIIGEYISAVYQEVKGRPRYVISRSLENKDA